MKESKYNIWSTLDDGSLAVFNGLSGALLRMSEGDRDSLWEYLGSTRDIEGLEQLLTDLAVARMLIPDDVDETATLAQRYAATRDDRSLFALTIVPSLGCNFDCPYCFEAKHPSLVSDSTEKYILQILDDQISGGVQRFHVTWFGGEPLLGKRAISSLSDEFVRRCDGAGVAYGATIVTNGYLLDEPTCVMLKQSRVQSAQIGIDGPPRVHNAMRPLRNGGATFDRIVRNLHTAVEHLDVSVRVNIDSISLDHVEELLAFLAAQGLAGRIGIYPGQLVGITENPAAPSATYATSCFSNEEFAHAEISFMRLVDRYGFGRPTVPRPTGAPCTAVRKNELIVGSDGELYKCWNNVGDASEVIGDISDYRDLNGRLQKWLNYDPFQNDECRSCIALPVCMGGCAHHAMSPKEYDNRCGTFRHTYTERIRDYCRRPDVPTRNRVLIPTQQLFQKTETR